MGAICLVVEGQSERAFAETILAPLAEERGFSINVLLPKTSVNSSGAKHGGGAWKHTRDLVVGLSQQPHWHRIGVMFDVYGSEFAAIAPGFRGHELHAQVLQAATEDLAKDFRKSDQRLVVGPVLHEFETLVIAALASGKTGERQQITAEAEAAIRNANWDVELVNGRPATSPSHRVRDWFKKHGKSGYEKVVDGNRIIQQADWEVVEQNCPTFVRWFDKLTRSSK